MFRVTIVIVQHCLLYLSP